MNDALELMDQLRTALRERDEARDALFRADQGALRVEEERDRLQRERDEARAELAGLPAWQKGCEQALGDLADAEEAIARLYTERDEARAEVERLREEFATQADISSSTIARMKQQLREACAEVNGLTDASTHWQVMLKREMEEVERLRRELERAVSRECDVPACNCGAWHHREHPRVVYRRGAEAMREACARWMSEREGISQWVYDDALSALPIPEEP